MKRRRKIGLALGSGGARGLAHLGVMTALQDAGLQVDVVSGASMGALVGIGVATDRIESMTRFALDLDWKKALGYFLEPRLPHAGLIGGDKVMELIRTYTRDRKIEELDIPYAAVAADLMKGTPVVLDSGPATEAVRASIAIPGLFTPVRIKRRLLVDGGLVDPVPVEVCRALGAEVVIAVDVTHFDPLSSDEVLGRKPPLKKGDKGAKLREMAANSFLAPVVKAVEKWEQEPRLLDVMGLSMRIMESHIADMRLAAEKPDYLIRPRMGNVFFMDFNRAPEIVKIGYQAGKAAIPGLSKLLASDRV